MNDKEAKVIQMPQSSVLNSPLLQEDEVEIKDYTNGLANMAAGRKEPTEPELDQPQVEQAQTQETMQEPVSEWEGKKFSYSSPNPPPPEPEDDVEEMTFSPQDEPYEQEHLENQGLSEQEVKSKADEDATMLITMFNQFVPQMLGEAIKTDTAKVRYVMKYNEIPEADIKEIEEFLNTSNAQLIKELKLNPVQIAMLKPALAKVLERHSLTPENPLVNLAIVVASIVIQKIMAIKQILAEQTTHLQMIIKGYQLKIPKGYEDIAEPRKLFRIKRKRKENLKEAA